MEVTAAERTTIYTNISPLAQRVNNYIQTQHSSIAAVAKDIGYSRTTVHPELRRASVSHGQV
jgi:IS30 family transposase